MGKAGKPNNRIGHNHIEEEDQIMCLGMEYCSHGISTNEYRNRKSLSP